MEKISGYDLENIRNQRKLVDLNFNTQVRSANGAYKDYESFLDHAPYKVAKRVTINMMGLNTLATNVIAYDLVRNLNMDDLAEILQYSNDVNTSIGLPSTTDLILRSSYMAPGNQTSEPALLVRNILNSKPTFELMANGIKKKLSNLKEFTDSLRNNTYLLVHDDNYQLQTGGIHLRLHESNFGNELLFGTGVLHCRELEMEDKRKPSIRINYSNGKVISHYDMNFLFDINSDWIDYMFSKDLDDMEYNGLRIKLKNINKATAIDLLNIIKKNNLGLMEGHEIGQQLKGDYAVTEFRIYKDLQAGLGKAIQVLDFD